VDDVPDGVRDMPLLPLLARVGARDLFTSDLRRRKSPRVFVRETMTPAAQRDEIVGVVRSALSARRHMMDLEKVR